MIQCYHPPKAYYIILYYLILSYLILSYIILYYIILYVCTVYIFIYIHFLPANTKSNPWIVVRRHGGLQSQTRQGDAGSHDLLGNSVSRSPSKEIQLWYAKVWRICMSCLKWFQHLLRSWKKMFQACWRGGLSRINLYWAWLTFWHFVISEPLIYNTRWFPSEISWMIWDPHLWAVLGTVLPVPFFPPKSLP